MSIYLHTIISFCQGARVWRTDGRTDVRTDVDSKVRSNEVRCAQKGTGDNTPWNKFLVMALTASDIQQWCCCLQVFTWLIFTTLTVKYLEVHSQYRCGTRHRCALPTSRHAVKFVSKHSSTVSQHVVRFVAFVLTIIVCAAYIQLNWLYCA